MICAAVTLFLTACNLLPSQVSPTTSKIPTQPILQNPASPTPGIVLTETLEPTETQPPVQTPTSTLPSIPSQTPTVAPAFDITQRKGQPPIGNQSDYLEWMKANTSEDEKYLIFKWERAQAILANKDATDPRIIEAFLRTPRESFFNPSGPAQAYESAVFSIGFGQTLPGPHLICHMVQAIVPQPNQKVLEIGTGSAYTSAILSELSNYVYTIEIVPELAQKADERYSNLSGAYPEYANIKRKNADGYYGWPEYAPFDRIIVTAGIDHVPPDLLAQLAPGGIMVIPVGPPSGQTVLKISKEVQSDGSITFVREDIYHGLRKIIFVPFTGDHNGP
jgi:protein-L-isoaspartate(D-aspartate) O-methyltransferase